MNKLTYLLLVFTLTCLISCQSQQTDSSHQEAAETTETFEYQRTSTWTEKDMNFQMNYCFQMVASVENLDMDGYCTCFLNKVKFYYEPLDVLHAYRQEHDISGECMSEHYYGKEEDVEE